MRILDFDRYALYSCALAAMLAGCGGPQPPIGARGAMPQSRAIATQAERGVATMEFAYVANRYSNNVSAYAIDPSTGALTQVKGSPFAADYGSYAVAIDPTGRFAYVANDGTGSGDPGDISVFAINPRDGALTPIGGSPFLAGSNPIGIGITPNDKFAYVANYISANISIFAINATTGGLKQLKGQRTRPFPTALATDPRGRFVYQTHQGFHPEYHPGHLAGYAINAISGALMQVSGAGKAAGLEPDSVAIDLSGKFLYVASWLSGTVSAYAITARTGALREVQGSPFSAGYNPGAVAVAPSGTFVYVPSDLGVYAYAVAPNGALRPIQGSPFPGGYEPDGIAVDALGKFVYVSTTGEYGKVSAYTVNPSNGALTQVQGSPFAAGTHPVGIATCEVKHDRCVPPTL
jgi:6-phosphogluconolactonase